MNDYRRVWKKHYGVIPKDDKGRSYDVHHLDGDRGNNSIENLECVSIQEHYNIHYKQGDWAAAHLIAERLGKKFTGWKHSPQARKKFKEAREGKHHSEETKKKIGDANRGKPKSQDHVEKNRKGHLGLKQTKQTVDKRKETIKNRGGYRHSEEIKLKMRKPKSQEHLQKMKMPRKLVVCPHCGKVGGSCAMKRWHFGNCRNIVFKKVG